MEAASPDCRATGRADFKAGALLSSILACARNPNCGLGSRVFLFPAVSVTVKSQSNGIKVTKANAGCRQRGRTDELAASGAANCIFRMTVVARQSAMEAS